MIAASFARLSTGIKMLIILSTALLPLGLIALFASIESAQTNKLNRDAEGRLMAVESARQLTTGVSVSSLVLRRVLSRPPDWRDPAVCRAMLADARMGVRFRFAAGLFDAYGRPICASGSLALKRAPRPTTGIGTELRLDSQAGVLRFALSQSDDGAIAVGEIPLEVVRDLTRPNLATTPYTLGLRQGDAVIPLGGPSRMAPLIQPVTVSAPVAGGQLSLEMRISAAPIRAIEVLMVLLPLLMWLAAAVIGWLVVDRLLLKPLAQMQRAINSYDVNAPSPLTLPTLTTPSQEIRLLGEAFRAFTVRLAAHEAELEEGLSRQTRLTREVHHRVKNNLQVVASLINLHARGAKSDEATRAYAAIQRRVDALAVVHRHHFAELEENRGVGLRPLIGELASNLRATAPPEAAHLTVTLELVPAYASQDTAVPVAFLITELVELAMSCDPHGGVAIRLRATDTPERAELSLIAPGLAASACAEHETLDRFNRVVEGLSRQLRSPLKRDPDAGSFAIVIAVVPQEDD